MTSSLEGVDRAEETQELEECDLVLKGGITSGIVYPQAVVELSQRYRFCGIGGTSAGAIAAVLTAAAEKGRAGGGFDRLKKLSEWLGKGANLFDLFQPTPKTRPVLTALLEINRLRAEAEDARKKRLKRLRQSAPEKTAREGKSLRWVSAFTGFAPKAVRRALPGQYWLYAIAFGVIGALLGALLVRGIAPQIPFWNPVALFVAVVLGVAVGWLAGLLGGLASLVAILFRHVSANFYGVCTGRRGACDRADAPALTDWLHEQINDLAGRGPNDPPLTFNDLKQGPHPITVRMVTTNVSLGEPFVLPFEEMYLARRDDMRRLFPEPVMAHLMKEARTSRHVTFDRAKFAEYFILPRRDDLPLVMAARLSLSFPVLLSAVPLYTIKRSAFASRKKDGVVSLVDPDVDLECHWFSDGGISSNFPIHFFDTWFPFRPTFGINLTSLAGKVFSGGADAIPSQAPESRMHLSPEYQSIALAEDDDQEPEDGTAEGTVGPADAAEAVFLPQPRTPQFPSVTPVQDLLGFFNAIWTTAQNHRDNMQARLPSYRERIVQIRFAPDEGGLNLAMGPAAIASIVAKGQLAGQRLRDQFSLNDHRWVRLRVLLPLLENHLRQAREVFPSAEDYRKFLDELPASVPYRGDDAWRERACRYLTALATLVKDWEAIHADWSGEDTRRRAMAFFGRGAPRPPASLRVTPLV